MIAIALWVRFHLSGNRVYQASRAYSSISESKRP